MTRTKENMRPRVHLLLVITISFSALLILPGCSRQPAELRLVVDELPVNQAIGEAMAEAASRHGAPIRLVNRRAGGAAALFMLRDGQADVALIENTTAFEPGIRSLMPVYPGVLHVAFRPGFDPADGADGMRGARIYAGSENSLAFRLIGRFLAALGLSMDEVRFMPVTSGDLPDIVAIVGPVASVRVEVLEGFQLYSVDSPQSVGHGSTVEGIRANYPQVRPYVIPRKVYPGITQKPVVTLAVDMILVARSDADPRVVYRLIEQLQQSRAELASQFPALFDGMNGDFDPDALNFPLHEGADRYLRRDEPSIYEQYAEVADAGLTIFLALLSGGFALMRYVKIRKKNRIDHYYTELMTIRTAGHEMSQQEIKQAQARVAEIEQEAFELLVDEKLAADDSFGIFLTLSDAVTRDLKRDALRLRGK